MSEVEAQPGMTRRALALIAALAGWALPGAGHLLLRRWMTGLTLFACVGALAGTGIALRGRIFSLDGGGFFELLGFVADCGAGVFFFLPGWLGASAADVSRAAGDYGTRFFATAGVLNVLCALDAYRLALQKN